MSGSRQQLDDALQVRQLLRLGLPGQPVPQDVLSVRAHATRILHSLHLFLPNMLVLVLQALRLRLQHSRYTQHFHRFAADEAEESTSLRQKLMINLREKVAENVHSLRLHHDRVLFQNPWLAKDDR